MTAQTKVVKASELTDDLRPKTYMAEDKALPLTEVKILVISQNYWGKGKTLREALANMRKAGGQTRRYVAYLAHPDSYVDGMGYITAPTGFRPIEFHRVGIKS
jgi:hypothetical protein